MKPTPPLFLSAVFAAVLLPGLALVGCKSSKMAEGATTSESGAAVTDSGIEIVRPNATEAPDRKEPDAGTERADAIAKKSGAGNGESAASETGATTDAPVAEKKKFRLFGKKDRSQDPEASSGEVAEKADGANSEEAPVAEPKRERKPLFGSRKKKDDTEEVAAEAESGAEPEVAAVKEKKKFRLFGFGRKKDQNAEESAEPEDDTIVAVNGNAGRDPETERRSPEPIEKTAPWDKPTPGVASNGAEDTFDPSDYEGFSDPDNAVGAASGVTARIRPTDTSGGFTPIESTPERVTSPFDRVPALDADPPVTRPRDDGFIPLTPEPKFPSEEGILPPGE